VFAFGPLSRTTSTTTILGFSSVHLRLSLSPMQMVYLPTLRHPYDPGRKRVFQPPPPANSPVFAYFHPCLEHHTPVTSIRLILCQRQSFSQSDGTPRKKTRRGGQLTHAASCSCRSPLNGPSSMIAHRPIWRAQDGSIDMQIQVRCQAGTPQSRAAASAQTISVSSMSLTASAFNRATPTHAPNQLYRTPPHSCPTSDLVPPRHTYPSTTCGWSP
jgi:hypothetical protein